MGTMKDGEETEMCEARLRFDAKMAKLCHEEVELGENVGSIAARMLMASLALCEAMGVPLETVMGHVAQWYATPVDEPPARPKVKA